MKNLKSVSFRFGLELLFQSFISTKIVINFLDRKNQEFITKSSVRFALSAFKLKTRSRHDRWANLQIYPIIYYYYINREACSRSRKTSSLPLRRNSEKWGCDVGVIKLHLQSTPHYNTAARWRGYPFEISSEKAANDWRRRRHREKIAFAAAERREDAGCRAIAHDFVGFCSSIQAVPLLLQPSYRVFQTIVANYAHCTSIRNTPFFCQLHLLPLSVRVRACVRVRVTDTRYRLWLFELWGARCLLWLSGPSRRIIC